MATIKSFTDLQQSKKLTKILPIESADMKILPFTEREYRIVPINDIAVCGREDEIYAWSLAALLEILPESYQLTSNKEGKVQLMLIHHLEKDYYDNPVDACVDMIIKLKENELI